MARRTRQKVEPLERVPSGIPGLDAVLHGGFLRAGVFIVQGMPGAGKTILGNQICFSHAAGGECAVYVTLLAESHARMLQHIGGLDFFDESVIPTKLTYISAFRIMEEEGLAGVLDMIRREVLAHKARTLVLDGLIAIDETAQTPREFKKFIHELQAHATIADCTVLLLTSPSEHRSPPEHTMVGGVVELHDEAYGRRTERNLRVLKLRGGGFLGGRHSFRISDAGVTVYPRIEAWLARPAWTGKIERKPVATGLAPLDDMIGGGLPHGSTTLLLGPAGSGKTTLGLHFLSQCGKDEPGLYFGLFEPPEAIRHKASALGLPLARLIDRGHVEILWHPFTEGVLDEACHRLVEAVTRRGVRRLVIDGLDGFSRLAVEPERLDHIFAAFTNELRARGVAAIYTVEARQIDSMSSLPLIDPPWDGISGIAENVVVLRYIAVRSRLHRLAYVLKARDVEIDTAMREFAITGKGIAIEADPTGAEALLADVSGRGERAAPSQAPPRKPRSGR